MSYVSIPTFQDENKSFPQRRVLISNGFRRLWTRPTDKTCQSETSRLASTWLASRKRFYPLMLASVAFLGETKGLTRFDNSLSRELLRENIVGQTQPGGYFMSATRGSCPMTMAASSTQRSPVHGLREVRSLSWFKKATKIVFRQLCHPCP